MCARICTRVEDHACIASMLMPVYRHRHLSCSFFRRILLLLPLLMRPRTNRRRRPVRWLFDKVLDRRCFFSISAFLNFSSSGKQRFIYLPATLSIGLLIGLHSSLNCSISEKGQRTSHSGVDYTVCRLALPTVVCWIRLSPAGHPQTRHSSIIVIVTVWTSIEIKPTWNIFLLMYSIVYYIRVIDRRATMKVPAWLFNYVNWVNTTF